MENKNIPANNEPVSNEWQGFTIEELKLRRAVALVRSEIAKEQMVQKLSNSNLMSSQSNIANFFTGSGASKAISFAILGYKVFNLFRNIRKRF